MEGGSSDISDVPKEESTDAAQGDAMRSFLLWNYGIDERMKVADAAQGDAMHAFIEREYPDTKQVALATGTKFSPASGAPVVPVPPPGERGRVTPHDPVEVVASAQARENEKNKNTQEKEKQAELLRQIYWEVQEANPELTPQQAVEVARDIYTAGKQAEEEGVAILARVEKENPEANSAPEGGTEESRGFEAYQRKFERDLVSEIAKLTPEQRVEAGWKGANLGFQMEKHKNQQFENIFRGVAKTIGGIGASPGRQNFMGRMLNAIGDQYAKRAERNDRTIQSIEKLAKTDRGTGIMTKLSNLGLIAGNINRVAQVAGLAVVPGGAALVLGAMATASVAEAGKESRLTSEEAMEKTRFSAENLTDEEKIAAWESYKAEHPEVATMTWEEQSVLRNKLENDLAVDKAWDEAKAIYETAMKNKSERLAGNILTPEQVNALDPKAKAEYQAKMNTAGETLNAQDFNKAYEQRIASTLIERIKKFQDVEPGTNLVSRFITKAAGWMMEKAVTSTQKKLEEIESSGLTTEEKNQRREEVMNRFGRGQLMKDIDRMLSQQGALDTIGALLWGTEKAAKAAVAVISIKNLYDIGHRFFGGPAPVSQESIDRFGADAATTGVAGNAIDTANVAPLKANFPVSEAVPSYTVVAGDNLMKILGRELPELQGLSPAEQEHVIQTMLRSMTPEQLVELGVQSGNIDLIKPGETLDMSKFNELVAMAKGGGGGGMIPPTGSGGAFGGGLSPTTIENTSAFSYGDHGDVGSVDSAAQELPPLAKAEPRQTDMDVEPVNGGGYSSEKEEALKQIRIDDGRLVQTKTTEQVSQEWRANQPENALQSSPKEVQRQFVERQGGGTVRPDMSAREVIGVNVAENQIRLRTLNEQIDAIRNERVKLSALRGTMSPEEFSARWQQVGDQEGALLAERSRIIQENNQLKDFAGQLDRRSAPSPVETAPRTMDRIPVSGERGWRAETAPLSAGVPKQYADNPRIISLLKKHELEDMKFENQWDEKIRRTQEAFEKKMSGIETRRSRAFTDPFDRAQRNMTQGIFNEAGRVIQSGTNKGIGGRVENVFRNGASDIVRGIGRWASDIPRNAEAAARAQEQFNEQMEKLLRMREAARIAHEIKQAQEIEKAIAVLERTKSP
jgi:hypothetical protein